MILQSDTQHITEKDSFKRRAGWLRQKQKSQLPQFLLMLSLNSVNFVDIQ